MIREHAQSRTKTKRQDEEQNQKEVAVVSCSQMLQSPTLTGRYRWPKLKFSMDGPGPGYCLFQTLCVENVPIEQGLPPPPRRRPIAFAFPPRHRAALGLVRLRLILAEINPGKS